MAAASQTFTTRGLAAPVCLRGTCRPRSRAAAAAATTLPLPMVALDRAVQVSVELGWRGFGSRASLRPPLTRRAYRLRLRPTPPSARNPLSPRWVLGDTRHGVFGGSLLPLTPPHLFQTGLPAEAFRVGAKSGATEKQKANGAIYCRKGGVPWVQKNVKCRSHFWKAQKRETLLRNVWWL